MLVVGMLLLTLWLGAQWLDVRMGAMVHLLAISALLIVLTRKRPRPRHS